MPTIDINDETFRLVVGELETLLDEWQELAKIEERDGRISRADRHTARANEYFRALNDLTNYGAIS